MLAIDNLKSGLTTCTTTHVFIQCRLVGHVRGRAVRVALIEVLPLPVRVTRRNVTIPRMLEEDRNVPLRPRASGASNIPLMLFKSTTISPLHCTGRQCLVTLLHTHLLCAQQGVRLLHLVGEHLNHHDVPVGGGHAKG